MLGVLYQKTAKFILRIRLEYSDKYRLWILAEITRHYLNSDNYLNSFVKLN